MLEKIKKILKKSFKWIILFICLAVFIKFTKDVFYKEIISLDNLAYKYIVEHLRRDWLTPIMKIITSFGDEIAIIVFTIVSIIIAKNKKVKLAIAVNVVLIALLNNIIKLIIKRPRPEGFNIITESGFSFPSGHSMVSAAFYGLLIYFSYKYIRNKKIKYTICVALSILILLIGISRIYLGVHFASDVLAGFLISIAYLICFTSITFKLIKSTKISK